MATPKEYRQHAAECLELAKAKEYFVKSALTELAEEFNKRADQMERAERVKAPRSRRVMGCSASSDGTARGCRHRGM
jgi:hypothetical protein